MRKKEILAEQYHKKYPCSEFEFSDLGDSEHYLPIAESAMQEYADEFACAFAEFIAENYVPILQHQKLQYWQKNYQDKSKKYTTKELLEIYKQQNNGK